MYSNLLADTNVHDTTLMKHGLRVISDLVNTVQFRTYIEQQLFERLAINLSCLHYYCDAGGWSRCSGGWHQFKLLTNSNR